jgi:uncharacterized lipoprotein YajG
MFIRLFVLIISLVLLAGCATSPTGRSQLVLMPESQINEMGQNRRLYRAAESG